MSIKNRTMGDGEKRQCLDISNNQAMTAGETGILAMIPFSCTLDVAQIAAFNIEGSANLAFNVSRFIPGQGLTTFFLGTTFVPPTFGTSGVLTNGVSILPAIGSTVLLLPNDIIGYQVGSSGGSTSAIMGIVGQFVVKPIQDVVSHLGLISEV